MLATLLEQQAVQAAQVADGKDSPGHFPRSASSLGFSRSHSPLLRLQCVSGNGGDGSDGGHQARSPGKSPLARGPAPCSAPFAASAQSPTGKGGTLKLPGVFRSISTLPPDPAAPQGSFSSDRYERTASSRALEAGPSSPSSGGGRMPSASGGGDLVGRVSSGSGQGLCSPGSRPGDLSGLMGLTLGSSPPGPEGPLPSPARASSSNVARSTRFSVNFGTRAPQSLSGYL